MPFCLPKHLTEKFMEKLRNGEITPDKMHELGSEGRRKFFAEFLGEDNAREVNRRLEKALIMPDIQRGMIEWAKKTPGTKAKVKQDMIDRVNGMTELLNPADLKAFKEDLIAHELGTAVTIDEAKELSRLGQLASKAKLEYHATLAPGQTDAPINEARLLAGLTEKHFLNYLDALKSSTKDITWAERRAHPLRTTAQELKHAVDVSKSIKSAFDISLFGRQLWRVFFASDMRDGLAAPYRWVTGQVVNGNERFIWSKSLKQGLFIYYKTLRGEPVADHMYALIHTDPEIATILKTKASIGGVEETFPGNSKYLEKMPLIGRWYKASELAYTQPMYYARYLLTKKYLKIARQSGWELNDATLESIGSLVNSLTARGKTSHDPGLLNATIWSPKMMRAHWDTLFLHAGDKTFQAAESKTVGGTPLKMTFARQQAALNLLSTVAGMAAIAIIANQVKPGSVEVDPRSSDFMKYKSGNTRIDLTGGLGALAILAARAKTLETKNQFGQVVSLNQPGFRMKNGADVLFQFVENKTSPATSEFIQRMRGKNREGKPWTWGGAAVNLYTPLPTDTLVNILSNPSNDAADIALFMIADALGFSTNTYSPPTAPSTGRGSRSTTRSTRR